MGRTKKYQNDDDELLHPFWLGLLMLFTVITVVGLICLLRKKCGSNIRHLFNRLRRRDELNHKPPPKINRRFSTISTYRWTPSYIPPANLSPKFYKFVRNMQMANLDKDSLTQQTESHEDNTEHDVLSITSESEPVKTFIFRSNRSGETARKFYASMRRTSQGQTSSSIESSNNDSSLLPTNRLIKSNSNNKLNLFGTTRFFQTIPTIHN